jgi:hypothetical protein
MVQIIKNLEDRPENLFYLSVFRLFICFHLLKKLTLSWTSLDTLYGTNSFAFRGNDPLLDSLVNISTLRDHYSYLVIIFYCVLILYLFGVGKHVTALLVYILLEVFQRLNGLALNGGDNLLKFLVLYMAFANSYEFFSWKRLQPTDGKFSNMFTNLALISILLHLCLVYLISGLSKAHTDVWYNGVAVYYIFHLERFQGTPWNEVLGKNGFFVTIATYFTLLYEIYFPVLIWFKKLRIMCLVIGVMLHLGIYTFMMIYDFQMVFIFVYGFLFTDGEYEKLLKALSSKFKFIKLLMPPNITS